MLGRVRANGHVRISQGLVLDLNRAFDHIIQVPLNPPARSAKLRRLNLVLVKGMRIGYGFLDRVSFGFLVAQGVYLPARSTKLRRLIGFLDKGFGRGVLKKDRVSIAQGFGPKIQTYLQGRQS